MHSFDWKGPAETYKAGDPADVDVTIHHNGDYSGGVKINVPTWYAQPSVHNFSAGGEDHHIAELSVPFAALKSLVIDYYRQKMVAALENAEGEELEQLLMNEIIEDGQK